ncbi:Bax inhibitor-1 family protein [bacterium]|nr:Bax inhibitor-1 family protein [bacterium]
MNEARFSDQLTFASQAAVDERADFITKTYVHLAGAVGAFAALCALFLHPSIDMGRVIAQLALGNGTIGMVVFFGCFMGISWLANSWAMSSASQPLQYAGLSLYVVAQAIFFAPLLFIAHNMVGPEVIPTAGVMTFVVFAGLTLIVFLTRYNFSFLGPALGVVGFAVMAMFLCSMIFGYNLSSLGIWLPAGMVVFAGCYILYDTSNVMHQYRIGQHVAASLALFSSVTLLFYYMVRLVMSLQRND